MKKCIFMAALALTFVACSKDDNDMAQQEGKIPFSATIAAPNSGATTRTTYTESGTSINVAWKSGDQIALVHGGVKDVVTVGTPNPDGSAPITGTITVGSDNEDIVLVYPADLVAVAVGGTAYTENTDVTNKFKTQAGNVDSREVTVKVGGNTVAYASTTSPYFSPSIVYLALNPATMGTGTLRIEAGGLGDTYYIEKSGVSLTAGKFYQSTLKMSWE